MNSYKLEDFTKGWFIGNFEPTLFNLYRYLFGNSISFILNDTRLMSKL